MTKEQKMKIGRATYLIFRKYVGNETLEKKIRRLILEQK